MKTSLPLCIIIREKLESTAMAWTSARMESMTTAMASLTIGMDGISAERLVRLRTTTQLPETVRSMAPTLLELWIGQIVEADPDTVLAGKLREACGHADFA